MALGIIRFQLNGAMCRSAEATLDGLCPVFEDRIISRRADVVWPPRSRDLTPLDYYLWSAVKARDNLKNNIREGLLDEKPGFDPQAIHQNKIRKVFLRGFPLSRFLAKALRSK